MAYLAGLAYSRIGSQSAKDIIFVDDRLDHLKIAKDALSKSKTIRIRRGKYKDIEFDFKPSCTIYNLQELTIILANTL